MTRPSDRAIAQAFWGLIAYEDHPVHKDIRKLAETLDARELDATAAPVVVGEDVELAELRAWKAEQQAFLVRLSVTLVIDGNCKTDTIEQCVDELIAAKNADAKRLDWIATQFRTCTVYMSGSNLYKPGAGIQSLIGPDFRSAIDAGMTAALAGD